MSNIATKLKKQLEKELENKTISIQELSQLFGELTQVYQQNNLNKIKELRDKFGTISTEDSQNIISAIEQEKIRQLEIQKTKDNQKI